jgi:hypothetical protein
MLITCENHRDVVLIIKGVKRVFFGEKRT